MTEDGMLVDIGSSHGAHLVTPPALPAPAPLDPTAALLDTPIGRVVEGHSGDAASALGIVGAVLLVANHRAGGVRSAAVEQAADRVISGAMASAAVDTGIQLRNVALDGPGDARARGADESSLASVAYAATGILPGASVRALRGVHRHPTKAEVVSIATLGANAGVLGYELVTRAPKMGEGSEDLSGYGSLLAAAGGFAVVRRVSGR